MTTHLRDTPAGIDPFLVSLPVSRSGRMPRESLDAPEHLPKQALRQVAFGQLLLVYKNVTPLTVQ